MNYIDYGGGDH